MQELQLLQVEKLEAGTEHEIRTKKWSDKCQHKIKFALTFSRNDQTLIEICMYRSIICRLGHLSDQTGICTGHHQKCSVSDVRLLFHDHALHV